MRKFVQSGSSALWMLMLTGLAGCGSSGSGTPSPADAGVDSSSGGGGEHATGGAANGNGGTPTSDGGRTGKPDASMESGGSVGDGGRTGGSGGSVGDGGRTGGSGGASSGGDTSTGGASSGGDTSTGGAGGDATGGAGGAGGGSSAGGAGGSGGEDAGSPDAGDGSVPLVPVTLNVDLTASVRPISPLIYGVNPGTALKCSDANARFTLCRQGTNAWSTYNWETNASNTGSACFENNGALDASNSPADAVTALMTEAGTRPTLVTVPMLDYVAADKNGGSGPPACTGDVRADSGFLNTRFKKNRSTKDTAISSTPDATDGFVNQDEFITFVKAQATAAQPLFAMDNQTELWSYTHTDVHPNAATYAEVVAKNIEYSTMVRGIWPDAKITGFVGYGYHAFLDLQIAPDSAGKPDFVTFYLAAMRQASDSLGKRLIDYLDLHWYSEATANGVRILTQDTVPPDPEAIYQRVQAPRSLWDPTYQENSWITNDQLHGPVMLIPWLNTRIAANNIGTKIAFSAWAHGGEDNISGGIAAADTLGVFGSQGVSLGATDATVTNPTFLIGAFAAFRNYDGAGAAFGDMSVQAQTSDISRVSVYASVDSTVANRTVIVVINRSATTAPTTLNLAHAPAYTTASVYQITSQSALPQPAAALTATASAYTLDVPAYSITVIVPAL